MKIHHFGPPKTARSSMVFNIFKNDRSGMEKLLKTEMCDFMKMNPPNHENLRTRIKNRVGYFRDDSPGIFFIKSRLRNRDFDRRARGFC